MQKPLTRLLPLPETLGARLALTMAAIIIISLALFILSGLNIAGRAPEGVHEYFVWVAAGACVCLVLLTGILWRTIIKEVLRPIEAIRHEAASEAAQEDSRPQGLGELAATMRGLRKTVLSTQEQLRESNRNLRHVEKLAMVGKLAAGVAHSVRNPLTSVKLRLFSLQRSLPLDEERQEDFTVIADAIRHVDGIVSNFLEFSRRPDLNFQVTSPSGITDAALKLLESRLTGFPVEVTINRSAPLPELNADPDQLREAMLNILLNACEAMGYDGKLEIGEKMLQKDGQIYARIAIKDSGPGIAAHLLPDIFTPFFSTKEQGTGLGLPIAKSILEEHGGDLLAESPQDGGTVFSLLLPLGKHGFPIAPAGLRSKHRPDIAAPV